MFFMEERLSVNILVREEEMEGKKVFVVNNNETGVADFGDTLDKAVDNFRKSLTMYLDAYPEKRKTLVEQEETVLVSQILL